MIFLHILKRWFLKMKDLKLFPDVFTHTLSFLRQSHVVQQSLKLTQSFLRTSHVVQDSLKLMTFLIQPLEL